MRRLIALLVLTLATACGGSGEDATPSPSPTPTIPGVQAFSGLSHDHLKKGKYPQDYAQSPPVGGPHAPVWMRCAVYQAPVPKELAVHSMEHGGIWVTYRPGLPAADLALLGQLTALNPEYVLVSPYPGQDAAVVVSTWGLQLELPKADDARLVQLVQTYAGGGQGGEKGAGCATGGATLEQALQFLRSQE